MSETPQITQLLTAWNAGDESALAQLLPLVETELRRIAHNFMRKENPNHTLQTTALVNEAYIKLVDQTRATWQNRAHFLAISAQIMRRILLNYARDQKAQKRGKDTVHLNIDDVDAMSWQKSAELIALDESLERLSKFDRIKSQIVEMRYFGGLTVEETASVLAISESSVSLHWRLARKWLKNDIESNTASS